MHPLAILLPISFLLYGTPSFAGTLNDLSAAAKEYRNIAKRERDPLYRLDRYPTPIIPNCGACNPMASLALAVNDVLEKTPSEETADRDLKDRIEIVERLASTVMAPESLVECENPAKHGLRLMHDIDDADMIPAFSTNLDLSKIESLKYRDAEQSVSFFRVKLHGENIIMRLERYPDDSAVVRFYRLRSSLPDLERTKRRGKSHTPASEPELDALAQKESGEAPEKNTYETNGPRITWRKNGLPEKVILFDFKYESGTESYKWTHKSNLSNSGFSNSFALSDRGGKEIFTLSSRGSGSSTELQIPAKIYLYEGVLAEGRVRISPEMVGAEMSLPSSRVRGNDSFGAAYENSGSKRSVYYSWAMDERARLTIRYRRERALAANTVTEASAGPLADTVMVHYERPF